MGGLVEDLLLLAELDRGRPLRTDPVDLHRICANVVEDSNASDHAHELTMAPGREVVVLGDAERLTQVAHNLVRNALAHTPPGSRVTVSAHSERGMGVIRVSDNGPGIDPALAAAGLRPLLAGEPGPDRAGERAGVGHRARHRRSPRWDGRGDLVHGGGSIGRRADPAGAGRRAPGR